MFYNFSWNNKLKCFMLYHSCPESFLFGVCFCFCFFKGKGESAQDPWRQGVLRLFRKLMWNRPNRDWTLSIRSCSSHPGHFSNFPTTLEHCEPAVAFTSFSLPCQVSQVIGSGQHNEWEVEQREVSWSLSQGAQLASLSPLSPGPWGNSAWRHSI